MKINAWMEAVVMNPNKWIRKRISVPTFRSLHDGSTISEFASLVTLQQKGMWRTLECKGKQKRIQVSHWRVKQGVSLNYTSLKWPQAGEALTLSRIQMWWSQGWGPTAPPDPQVENRQAGPAVSGSSSAGLVTERPLKAEPPTMMETKYKAKHDILTEE